MLAAVPSVSDSLELFKLALSLVASGNAAVPGQLQSFIEEVVQDAKTLMLQPSSGPIRHRESIDLALAMRHDHQLAENVSRISGFQSIKPAAAAEIIGSMEYHPA